MTPAATTPPAPLPFGHTLKLTLRLCWSVVRQVAQSWQDDYALSMGAALVSTPMEIAALWKMADENLYRAKEAGRGCAFLDENTPVPFS